MRTSHARSKWAELLDLTIEHESDRPLFQQIYLMLRDAIVANALSPGSRLPSTRQLADRLAVSRTSVLSAYEQLLAEGYIVGREGSGTYVSDDVPRLIVTSPSPSSVTRTAPRQTISEAGARYREFAAELTMPDNMAFATGCCSVDASTIEAWRRVGVQQMRTLDPVNLGYADPLGELALRKEVAEYLRAARAVRCDPDQIVIVSGAQQAIDLSLRTLLDPGDAVWVEDPGYPATRAALIAAGSRLVAVPVDDGGLIVAAGITAAPDARAVYVTPSHQYPTGSVMTMSRRLELLAWASRHGAWIIEDDYDSEFRYVGRPLASLQGLDRDSCVIYVGSLSKVLFPGLRLGFAVVPRHIVDVFKGARFLSDRHPPTLLQTMAAEFMRQGFLTSHIRRMRQRYREARDAVVEAVDHHMGDLVEIEVPECGIQLVVHFKRDISDIEVSAEARRHGVAVRPVSPLYLQAARRNGLVLGYSGFAIHRLRAASAELAKAAFLVAERGVAVRPFGTVPAASG
jgi:GntR family transcriptional regulator/MocR family aminotransferase